ncbi:plasmodesmata-located protein 7-like [Rhodamnia argentea]|uniref:Plasmodesmata-located protein 7-like n=1 Tax=Rhodamnia argentea TaxID=178133 RepID=A0A8B8PR04_9MYRT|nr:plasmodesmata-located protein 7-like [Rhodamnia argentea]
MYTRMARSALAHSLFAFLLSLSFIPSSHASPPSSTFLFGGCTQQRYAADSAYESNLDSLLTSLLNSATYSSYNNFTVEGSSPQDVVYGLYQCRGDLSMPDCATCVARAVVRAGELCPKACGGAVQLEGCYAKYDNDSFLGVEDKTVVMKKCGPSDGYEAGPMGQRDAVLASLASGGGQYRTGGSGEVQGSAQCVGDLSAVECQDCLSEAIGRLKSECGTAVFGDMFLGKCYARYSTGGSGQHVYPQGHERESTDEGSKTFAIIIGLLAGVALLIIFVAFIRKVFEGNGK